MSTLFVVFLVMVALVMVMLVSMRAVLVFVSFLMMVAALLNEQLAEPLISVHRNLLTQL